MASSSTGMHMGCNLFDKMQNLACQEGANTYEEISLNLNSYIEVCEVGNDIKSESRNTEKTKSVARDELMTIDHPSEKMEEDQWKKVRMTTVITTTNPPPTYSYATQPQPGYAQPVYGQQSVYAQPVYGQPTGYTTQPVGYNAGAQTVIVNQPNRAAPKVFRSHAVTMDCPNCSANITTSTSRSCGGLLWVAMGVICLVGLFLPFLWLGCCLIPLCIPAMYDTRHTCPNCQRELGVHDALNI